MKSSISFRRLSALCRKETWQILRDPSSNLIAFVLPVVMMFIFGYGINLDSTAVNIGLVLEDSSPEARHFADNLYGSRYFVVHPAETQAEVGQALVEGRVRGFVVVPKDFAEKLKQPTGIAPLLVVTDGAEPNTANFVQNYMIGAWTGWLRQRASERGETPPTGISIEPRFWFNPSAESRNYLIPGSITIIMTVIGSLLTSLVVAREWERGTMEALLATPVTRAELLLSKLLPYYLLGIVSLFLCVGVAALMMHVPFRGSLLILWGIGSLFLASSLGLGLLLSTILRNQFVAAQAALNAAFLPAMMLSGFLFEIRSMPAIIQGATYLIPARYFVTALQTLFQAGNVAPVLLHSGVFLVGAGSFFIGLTALKTRRSLE
ncbi:ABC transporter permease [Methylomonas sp. UP202]|uniref:ABC transporter permease n=1 Tax=Methylomonas sp. UP202 TaxID=3040943 RepID=UPI00247929E8|nr:ABC transporter permease [Methylomonas sp. UP202]WGS84027.1 ABC transporter permease [Methylomonas sp. UP202]